MIENITDDVLYDPAADACYLRERTTDITDAVRQTLSPNLGRIATNVVTYGSEFYRCRESYRDFFQGTYVPYKLAAIPPDFFDDGQPHTFETEQALERHLDNYWYQDDIKAEHENAMQPLWGARARTTVAAELKRIFIESPIPMDFSGWDEYSQADMNIGRRTFMLNSFFAAHVQPQAAKAGFFDYFTEQTEAGLITNSILLAGNSSVAGIYRSPILQNDRELTNRLLNAGLHAAIVAANDEAALHDFDALLQNDDNRELFHRHVQRTSKLGGTSDRNFGPDRLAYMATESFMTVAGALAFMAQVNPEGYPYDGYQLISDLAEQNMVDKLTRLVPFGFIGPALLFGRYIPGLLYATEDDRYDYRLRFNPDAVEVLSAFAERVQADHAQQWRDYDRLLVDDPTLFPPVQTGGRCPFSGKIRNNIDPASPIPSAVSSYTAALATVFRLLNAA